MGCRSFGSTAVSGFYSDQRGNVTILDSHAQNCLRPLAAPKKDASRAPPSEMKRRLQGALPCDSIASANSPSLLHPVMKSLSLFGRHIAIAIAQPFAAIPVKLPKMPKVLADTTLLRSRQITENPVTFADPLATLIGQFAPQGETRLRGFAFPGCHARPAMCAGRQPLLATGRHAIPAVCKAVEHLLLLRAETVPRDARVFGHRSAQRQQGHNYKNVSSFHLLSPPNPRRAARDRSAARLRQPLVRP